MISYTFKRFQRSPLPALGVLLFAVILSAVLCGLQAASDAEQRNYDETYHTLPIYLTVTNLTATKYDHLEAPGWFADLFTGEGWIAPKLSNYVKDVQVRTSHVIDKGPAEGKNLVGITSRAVAKELLPENGGAVTWYPGYDESCLSGEEPVCLIPESLAQELAASGDGQELYMYFSYTYVVELSTIYEFYECERTMKVIGTYTAKEDLSIYCPYSAVRDIYVSLNEERHVDAISATLKDNEKLDEFRLLAGAWFVEPNPLGTKVPWDYPGYDFYPYALDINDDLLTQATTALQNSMTINRVSAFLVFVLSAGAGFLVGFLMIRQRKREIALMRTMGTPNLSIYVDFALEQMLCILAGTLLGGAVFLWRPIQRLGLFVGIYFLGMTLALIVFLHRNLMTLMKEDE